MRKIILMIAAVMMFVACGGKKTQAENADASVIDSMVVDSADAQQQEKEIVDVSAFVEEFYKEWDKLDLLDYGYVKRYVTPNLLKYLADAYDYDCEGECLATWKFFYEGGGDVGELKSRQITARDGNHVLVENKYVNYEYDVLLTLVKDGDTFKIDSLVQEKSEYK